MFPLVPTGGNPVGYQIARSLRLRSSATASLNRTPASASNRQIFTYSGWVKLGSVIGASAYLVSANTAAGFNDGFGLNLSSGAVTLSGTSGGTTIADLTTTQVLRDPSGWYHIVYSVDTTQATASNRVKIYINGAQVTAFATATYPAQNTNFQMNNNVATYIGRLGYTSSALFDGYFAEVNFIDGQALTPSSFGLTDTTTGVWTAKRYSGTYGTNGFYLPFTDNTALTTASNVGIGKDFSGNGNYWVTNNVSITAGATYDSMLDVPLAVGTTDRGNFATLNPLRKDNTALTVDNGNLRWTAASIGSQWAFGTQALTAKTYWEVIDQTAAIATYGNLLMGIASATFPTNGTQASAGWIGVRDSGDLYRNGTTNPVSTGSPYSTGATNDIWMFAYDPATTSLWIGRNGTWFNSGAPASGTGAVSTVNLGGDVFPACGGYQGGDGPAQVNFGQRPFAYTPPTGFKALHTGNLPAATILKPNKHFDVVTRAGTSAVATVTGTQFAPDLVWIKGRSNAFNHVLMDKVRGAGSTTKLGSSTTSAESGTGLDAFYGYVSAFNSDGYTLDKTGTDANEWGQVNRTSATYVDWLWKAGGAAVSNTAGSISAQVSANAAAGFSIVTYTGNGTSGATFGHGLGVAPSLVIGRCRSNTEDWPVRHTSLTAGNNLRLNATSAQFSASGATSGGIGAVTSSTVATVQGVSTNDSMNGSGKTYVAYCFAEIAGYSKFGSYTGNGSVDGPFVYCGFRPRYVMVKRTDTTGDWHLLDSARDTYNPDQSALFPNLSIAEAGSWFVDFTANGFKVRNTGTAENASGSTYIFAAFAESPFNYALAR